MADVFEGGQPVPDSLRLSIARLAALHGLGRIDGGHDRKPPNEKWSQGEWEKRILECIPSSVEHQCLALADDILALVRKGLAKAIASPPRASPPNGCSAPTHCTYRQIQTEPPSDIWVCSEWDCPHAIRAAVGSAEGVAAQVSPPIRAENKTNPEGRAEDGR